MEKGWEAIFFMCPWSLDGSGEVDAIPPLQASFYRPMSNRPSGQRRF
jgi:hypothetical protein